MYKPGASEPESWTASADDTQHGKVAYGTVDSPFGAIISFPFTPLYMYATLKGKFDFWDRILSDLPDTAFEGPTLDAGCGSGMVLIKTAQHARNRGLSNTNKAYGIDIFDTKDQSGNSPEHTLNNVRAEGVGEGVVLQRGSFTDLPYTDETFSLVTSSLALHNPSNVEDRRKAVRELLRILKPGGHMIILDLVGRNTTSLYLQVLKDGGMSSAESRFAGAGVMFGLWYCNVVQGVKAL